MSLGGTRALVLSEGEQGGWNRLRIISTFGELVSVAYYGSCMSGAYRH